MNNKSIKNIAGKVIFFFIILIPIWSFAYPLPVHKKITENTLKIMAGSINIKINNQTGLDKGIEQELAKDSDNKTVSEWIQVGSVDEDSNLRFAFDYLYMLYSHFYDPLTNSSGVGGSWESAYDWANASNNSWSWKVARNRFKEGLTLTGKTAREEALADAFNAIGHVIHLVQDMAVPAHTRGELSSKGALS